MPDDGKMSTGAGSVRARTSNQRVLTTDAIPFCVSEGPSPHVISRTLSIVDAKLETSTLPTDVVIKIHGTGVRPSYMRPWLVQSQKEWTGTGFVLPERRIMTNAHVVQDSTVLQVTKQDDPHKYRAFAACIAHDLDLAILTVDDDHFWMDLPHATFASELPVLYTEVKAVGFPTGGATVCVTKGIVSRIDAQVYVHPRLLGVDPNSKNSPGSVILIQIDAAINPGNSGGPTFDKNGNVVGVASSGLPNQQNVGYIIPAPIAKMFLEEFSNTGAWSGISEMGLFARSLESDSMRSFLKMGDAKGVLVTDVAPLGQLHNKVNVGDVVTHVDGLAVTNEGMVPIAVGGQKIFVDADAVVTRKAKGESTTFRILRGGAAMDIDVVLGPVSPLAPRFHGFDASPEFVMVGGVVFTQGTGPLHSEYVQVRPNYPFISDSAVWDQMDQFKKEPGQEVVVLLTILKHDVNLGYGHNNVGVLDTFNEQKVTGLAQFARLVGEALLNEAEEYLRFCMIGGDGANTNTDNTCPDIVLLRDKVQNANKEICATNHIPNVASANMLPHLKLQPAP